MSSAEFLRHSHSLGGTVSTVLSDTIPDGNKGSRGTLARGSGSWRCVRQLEMCAEELQPATEPREREGAGVCCIGLYH